MYAHSVKTEEKLPTLLVLQDFVFIQASMDAVDSLLLVKRHEAGRGSTVCRVTSKGAMDMTRE